MITFFYNNKNFDFSIIEECNPNLSSTNEKISTLIKKSDMGISEFNKNKDYLRLYKGAPPVRFISFLLNVCLLYDLVKFKI